MITECFLNYHKCGDGVCSGQTSNSTSELECNDYNVANPATPVSSYPYDASIYNNAEFYGAVGKYFPFPHYNALGKSY